MLDIRAFRGIRYDSSRVGDLSEVVCPPYDIISHEDADRLRRLSGRNAVHLELPRSRGDAFDDNQYERAAMLFRSWLADGSLKQDSDPAMYVLEEEFPQNGGTRRRRGLTTAVRLEDFGTGAIIPHEHTRPGPKADRLALMSTTRANISSIMCLYRDRDAAVERLLDEVCESEPDVRVEVGGGYRYALWTIQQPKILAELTHLMKSRELFIADGHHRYEAALMYRDRLATANGPLPQNAAARYMMATLFSMDDPGLEILPFHRVLSNLTTDEAESLAGAALEAFTVTPIAASANDHTSVVEAVDRQLAAVSPTTTAYVALGLFRSGVHLLTTDNGSKQQNQESLVELSDTWLLNDRVIDRVLSGRPDESRVSFSQDTHDVVRRVQSGEAQMAFVLRPFNIDLFESLVRRAERLPPKSTCFFPKLPTGLIMNCLKGTL